jgi:hypothetical protein
MMTTSTPQYRHSVWKPSKSDDGSDAFSKLSKNKTTHVSLGQALILVALSVAFAAVATAFIAVYYFSHSLPDIYSDQLVAPHTRRVISRTPHLRHAGYVRTTHLRHGGYVVNVYDEIVDVIVEDSSSTKAPVLSVGIESFEKDNEESVRGELVLAEVVNVYDEIVAVIVEDSSSVEAPWSEVLPVGIKSLEKDHEESVRGELVLAEEL